MEFIIIIQHGTNIKIMAQKLWPWNKSKNIQEFGIQ